MVLEETNVQHGRYLPSETPASGRSCHGMHLGRHITQLQNLHVLKAMSHVKLPAAF